MVQLLAFLRSLRLSFLSFRVLALALCSASIAVSVTPAHARSHHGAGRHARAYHAGHHARRHYVHIQHHIQHHAHIQRRHLAEVSRWDRGVAQMRAGGFANTNASFSPNASAAANSTLTPTGGAMASSFGSSGIVAE